MSEERRKAIKEIIVNSSEPITGTELADIFKVSRQVIVQDIALLRAVGILIMATTNGYMIPKSDKKDQIIKTFVSKHEGLDQLEEELQIIIEYGGKIIDVIVDHPVYGEIIGNLLINDKADIQKFVEKVRTSNAKPLSILTSGEHFHTIEVPSEKIYNLIIQELSRKGFVNVDN